MYGVWDTENVCQVKERKSKDEGVDADDVDLTHEGKRVDDNQQWSQTDAFRYFRMEIYMYKRWEVL